MKINHVWAAYLWILQVVTGLALTAYVVIHTIDNGAILLGQDKFDAMLHLWHSMPKWFYGLMVFGLVLAFALHALNGIRIASKPYKQIDISFRHNFMLKHPGTTFWFTQVLTGSIIAIFATWHLINQHTGEPVNSAVQSAANVTPGVFLIYVILLAAVLFHAFNGIRSVLLKLGYMTSRQKEGILLGILGLLFLIFFVMGVASVAKFLPDPETFDNPAVDSVSHEQESDSDRDDEEASDGSDEDEPVDDRTSNRDDEVQDEAHVRDDDEGDSGTGGKPARERRDGR